MKALIIVGSPLFGLALIATSADARMMGSGASTMPSHFSSSTMQTGTSVGSVRSFNPDGRVNHFKKPIDSDGGGPSDPSPKPTTTGTGGGTKVGGTYGSDFPHRHYGYGSGPWFPGNQGPVSACKGKPSPCP